MGSRRRARRQQVINPGFINPGCLTKFSTNQRIIILFNFGFRLNMPLPRPAHPRCPLKNVSENFGSRTRGFVVSPIGARLPNSRPVENTKARFPAQPLQSFLAALHISVFCLQDDSVQDILLSRHKLQRGTGLSIADRQSDSGRLGWGSSILRIGGRIGGRSPAG